MSIEALQSRLSEYRATYFPNEAESLQCSRPYDINKEFREEYPNSSKPGVYAIFDAEMRLLYVGKSNCLGKRLSNYFQWEDRKAGTVKIVDSDESWGDTRPAFLATIAVEKDWEASSLEEFLIFHLKPPANKTGNTK